VSDNTLQEIVNAFKDEKVGCITGSPVATNPRNTKYGHWAKLSYDGIDKVRKKLSNQKQFLQTSGYLFAMKKLFDTIPKNALSDDAVMSHMIHEKGYKISYAPEAKVFVKFPDNLRIGLNRKNVLLGGLIS